MSVWVIAVANDHQAEIAFFCEALVHNGMALLHFLQLEDLLGSLGHGKPVNSGPEIDLCDQKLVVGLTTGLTEVLSNHLKAGFTLLCEVDSDLR